MARPQVMCTSKWQCISHTPGLSATNRMTAHPFTGTATVFLIGGSSRLNLVVWVAALKLPKPSARM
uniref:Uncharacterized protein n=1 Tax=Arundo donax TaxID=35708 RepID=A0A0A8Y4B2_ARUDO